MKYIFTLLFFINTLTFGQSGVVYETYKTKNGSTNESDGTIFNKPFQEYNYIKTYRGIEVYETYRTKNGSTNESHGTIFSKPFPKYIIIGNKMYRTYKTDSNSTNQSNGTIFTQPFESKDIEITSLKENIKSQVQTTSIKYNGPTYDGETYNSGDGE